MLWILLPVWLSSLLFYGASSQQTSFQHPLPKLTARLLGLLLLALVIAGLQISVPGLSGWLLCLAALTTILPAATLYLNYYPGHWRGLSAVFTLLSCTALAL